MTHHLISIVQRKDIDFLYRCLRKVHSRIGLRIKKIEKALAAVDKLLDVYRRLNVSWSYRGYENYIIYLIAIRFEFV